MRESAFCKTGYRLLSEYRAQLIGVAMLWVMLYHAFPLTIPVHLLDAVKRMGYAGVDIMLFLSALGLAVSALRRPRPYGQYLVRRAARILPAFWLVTVPFYLWKLLTGRIALRSALLNLCFLGYWLHVPDSFNWFVPALVVYYLLAPLMILILVKSGRARDLVTVCAVAVGIAVCELIPRVSPGYTIDFFLRIPIFWVGLRLGFAVQEETPLDGKRLALWGAMLALGALYIYFRQFSAYYYFPVVYGFLLTTVPLCLLLCLLMRALPIRPLLWALGQIGRCSFEIYLLNATWFIEFDFFCALTGLRPAVYCLIGIPVNILLGIGVHYGLEALQNALRRHESKKKL